MSRFLKNKEGENREKDYSSKDEVVISVFAVGYMQNWS
jgi:hypothetical protein